MGGKGLELEGRRTVSISTNVLLLVQDAAFEFERIQRRQYLSLQKKERKKERNYKKKKRKKTTQKMDVRFQR